MVWPMRLIQVDIIGLETAQTVFNGLDDLANIIGVKGANL
jgi:hypothetical protein